MDVSIYVVCLFLFFWMFCLLTQEISCGRKTASCGLRKFALAQTESLQAARSL